MRGGVESQAVESRPQTLDVVRHRRRRFERFENRNEFRKGLSGCIGPAQLALKRGTLALIGFLVKRFGDFASPLCDALIKWHRHAVDVAGLGGHAATGLGCDAYVRSVEKAKNRFAPITVARNLQDVRDKPRRRSGSQRLGRAEPERNPVTAKDRLEMAGIRIEVACNHRDAVKRDPFGRRTFQDTADRARDFLDFATAGRSFDNRHGSVGPRRAGVVPAKDMCKQKSQSPLTAAASNELRQNLVGDRFLTDEAVPGEFREPICVYLVWLSLNREFGVADEANKSRHNHELEKAEIVNLRNQQTRDACEKPRPRTLSSRLQKCVQNGPFAIMCVGKTTLVERSFVTGEDSGDHLDPRPPG